MDKRQRILAITVLVLLAGFVLETFAREPWSNAMKEASDAQRKADRDLKAAKEKASREPEITREWKALKERLAAVKSEEASTTLTSFVDKLIRKHDLKKSSLAPEAATPLAGSPTMREHALVLSFQCSWDSFVKLLVDLYSADEFVRIRRIGVQSHYLTDKESYLDVNLRLTTVSGASK